MALALHTRSTGALVTQISQRSCHRASPCAPNLARSLQRQHGGPRRRAGQDLSSKAAASAASPAQQPAPSSNSRWRSSLPRVLLCVALLSLLALVFRPAAAVAATSASGAGRGVLDFVLHLDKHLQGVIDKRGAGSTYGVLWAIVFAETGFVLTPFLPGDSLLFAAGAFCASGALRLATVCGVFLSAAILGDAVNYYIGSRVGEKALSSRLIKQEFIAKTKNFYAKYGGKTIVLARFVPIIRTFAPFVAGVGHMQYSRFAAFNVLGALLWVSIFTGAGFLVGGSPAVKDNFALVVLAIVAVSVLPVIVEVWNNRRSARQSTPEALVAGTASVPNFAWITPAASRPRRDPNLDWLL